MSNKKNQQEILKHRHKQQITLQEESKTIILIKQVFTQLRIPILNLRIYSTINREILNSIIPTVQILTSIKAFKSLLRVSNPLRIRSKLSSLKLIQKRTIDLNQLLLTLICLWGIKIRIDWYRYKIKIEFSNFLHKQLFQRIHINLTKFLGSIKWS